MNLKSSLSIGEVAARAGLATSAIRYYEQRRLLPAPERAGGRRRYDPDVLSRLAVIDAGRRAGFTLDEIGVLMSGIDRGEAPSAHWRALAEAKLPELEARMRELEAMREVLLEGVRCECVTLERCELLLAAPEPPPATG